ncbi:MAG: AraC family transcriptional regulator [Gemmatimonadetes bacterium]|nr:AraC family transcriptional regulator [Gemmatimonadota bacterium]
MRYEEFPVPPELAGHLLSIWRFERPADSDGVVQHFVPPDGCVSLAVAAHARGPTEMILIGAHDRPLVVPIFPGDRYWGMRFWPDAGAACLRVEAAAWVGRSERAPAHLSAAAAGVVRALDDGAGDDGVRHALSRWALGSDWATVPLDAPVRLAVLAIVASKGAIPVGELPGTVGLTPRTLLRRFRAATGLTLKRYAKVRRFREAAARHVEAPATTWSYIAADVGYSDHAHLTREFREIHGAPPSEVARLIGRISHGKIRP